MEKKSNLSIFGQRKFSHVLRKFGPKNKKPYTRKTNKKQKIQGKKPLVFSFNIINILCS
jgi:hypothetical protein